MTQPQQRFLKMLDQMKLEYEENKPVYATVSAIPENFEQLFDIRDQINVFAPAQIVGSKGVTKTKNDLKMDLADKTYTQASGIYAWADKTKNAIILGQVDMEESHIKALPDQVIASSSKAIYDIGMANINSLAAYGVTAATLQELKDAIDAYLAALPAGRKNQLDKSGTTKKLAALFAAAKLIVEKTLDRLVRQLKKTAPDVYASYKAARKVPRTPIHDKGNNNDKGTPPAPTAE